jgi:hypothetical protein
LVSEPFSGFLCAPGEAGPSTGSTGPLAPGGTLSQRAMDAKSRRQGGQNIISEPRTSPQKCSGNLRQRRGTPRLFQEAVFISVPAAAQQIHIQRLSPENKGVSSYIPLQAGYRNKQQGLTHIWLHVTLFATLPPVLCDLLHV